MIYEGSKKNKGFTTIISISIPHDFMNKISPFIMNGCKGKDNQLTLHLPVLMYEYLCHIKKGTISNAVVLMGLRTIEWLEKEYYGKVFLNASSFIRQSILNDMILPKKQRVTTLFILRNFSENIKILKITKQGKSNKRICLGNIYHPNGAWSKYYTTNDIKKNELFNIIYKKVHLYFTAKEVTKNFSKFKKAYKYNLLNEIKTYADVLNISNFLKKDIFNPL